MATLTLIEEYLKLQGGSVERYHEGLAKGQRLGQAFFNALSEHDQGRLVTTPHDPFYTNDQDKVYESLAFLIDSSPSVRR